MPNAAPTMQDKTAELLVACTAASAAARDFLDAARAGLTTRLAASGRISNSALEAEQHAAHALAWVATCVESLEQMRLWAGRLDDEGQLGEMEQLILRIAFGEYLSQLRGGIPMSQGEIARPQDMGTDAVLADTPEIQTLAAGNTDGARKRLVALIIEAEGRATFGATGLDE